MQALRGLRCADLGLQGSGEGLRMKRCRCKAWCLVQLVRRGGSALIVRWVFRFGRRMKETYVTTWRGRGLSK